MSSIIQFEYQYRDAGNWKKHGELFFSNPRNRSVLLVELEIKNALVDKVWFVAHQIQVPELFLFENHKVTEADHCYHEFVSVQILSTNNKSELVKEPIDKLIARFRAAATDGWSVFDPICHFQ